MPKDELPAPLPALVLVPRQPGPVILPPALTTRPPDDVDQMLDELFGAPVPDRPGPLDAGLIAGGSVAAAFALLAPGWRWLLLVGVLSILLGLALPLRVAWRAVGRLTRRRRFDAILRQGDPLNLTDPTTRHLVEAYERIAAAPSDPAAAEALEAAHLALLEVSSLLRGRVPRGRAEAEYVARRNGAVQSLATNVVDQARDAAVEALDHFERRTGLSSLERMDDLERAMSDTRQSHPRP